MTRLETHALTEDDLPDAGRLLAARHRRHRSVHPQLPEGYDDPATAQADVAATLALDGASGAVATRGGEAVGFLLGAPKAATAWGRNAWVEASGTATADGEDAETTRELYAAAAARWVDEGRRAHYVLVPSSEAAVVDGWFRLGFGLQQAHALREPPTAPPPPPRSGLVVRAPVRDDIPALARLDLELPRHHAISPTFSGAGVPTYEESLGYWEEDFDNPDFVNAVAEHEGQVVATASCCRLEKSGTHTGPARPDRAWFLSFAAVLPEARGIGAGRAVAEAVVDVARTDPSYDVVVTDWREPNLTSSRAWRRLGFRDSFWRLHRLVGH
jgi:ribosomal protein S18 acetylase RimI-like enzyme